MVAIYNFIQLILSRRWIISMSRALATAKLGYFALFARGRAERPGSFECAKGKGPTRPASQILAAYKFFDLPGFAPQPGQRQGIDVRTSRFHIWHGREIVLNATLWKTGWRNWKMGGRHGIFQALVFFLHAACIGGYIPSSCFDPIEERLHKFDISQHE